MEEVGDFWKKYKFVVNALQVRVREKVWYF